MGGSSSSIGVRAFAILNAALSQQSINHRGVRLTVHRSDEQLIIYNPLQVQEVFQQLLHRSERRALLFGVRLGQGRDPGGAAIGDGEPDPDRYGGRRGDYLILASLLDMTQGIPNFATYEDEPKQRILETLAAT